MHHCCRTQKPTSPIRRLWQEPIRIATTVKNMPLCAEIVAVFSIAPGAPVARQLQTSLLDATGWREAIRFVSLVVDASRRPPRGLRKLLIRPSAFTLNIISPARTHSRCWHICAGHQQIGSRECDASIIAPGIDRSRRSHCSESFSQDAIVVVNISEAPPAPSSRGEFLSKLERAKHEGGVNELQAHHHPT
jgi:hypothetical protein